MHRNGQRTVAVKQSTRSALTSLANRATIISTVGLDAWYLPAGTLTFQVIWPERVTPLRNTVGFVYSKQTDLDCTDGLNKTLVVQTFWRYVSEQRSGQRKGVRE